MSWKASAVAKELTHGKHGQKISMADKLVLMILSENYLDDKGYVWCSQKLLSKHCACSQRGLRGILERLDRFGLVGIVHRGRLGNFYTLLFMRNSIPQSVQSYEEHDASIEEAGAAIEEPHAFIEERAVPPERLTVKKTVDGIAPSARTCPDCGKPIDRNPEIPNAHCQFSGKHPNRKKDKSWPKRSSFTREAGRVEEKPKRSTGEERAAIIRDRGKVLTDPTRLSASVRDLLSTGTTDRERARNLSAWAKAPDPAGTKGGI